jgi:hypothetical protein
MLVSKRPQSNLSATRNRGKHLMSLQKEIDKARAEIRTDGYPMSIGEWISLYERGEIDIHPEFQRFFRWSPQQKSRLIESVLLGIPIPEIFVAQREDGVWDVVDGLQRLSTIFQFVGILKDEAGTSVDPLTLEPTKYLPLLGGKRWEDSDKTISFTAAQQLLVKRSKIGVSIILKESDQASKYELFQRLNTGGSPLSDQEVRNSILIMMNRKMFNWLRQLSEDRNFQECIAMSDRATEEQYDMELVVRFTVFRTMMAKNLVNLGDLGEFLTDRLTTLAYQKRFDYKVEEDIFRRTFQLLEETMSSDSFRRYDAERQRFLGGFSVSAYEAVALGVAHNLKALEASPGTIEKKIKRMWSDRIFKDNSGSGVRASSRVPKIIPYGRQLFAV